ncbi:EAL domain-containing protein [Frankia sp. R43]|uniref:sensor domain-containing phosphodiesterase n=1 Tax=Frankia sp. R43 TaxID=269536 RepID=UPI00210114B2|nr:EAL domain-containing protein [Frankia sp. R43]
MEGPETRDHNDEMRRVLDLARRHLRTDVAWLARFSGDHQVIDLVAGDGDLVESLVGYRVDKEQTYCARVLDGRLPAVVPDARADRRTANLPVTRDLGIGSYVGTPVHLDNGELYGMLCALGTEPDPNLGERDVRFLSLLADVLTDTVSAIHRGHADDDHVRSVIGEIIDSGGPTMVFQAMFDLPTHGIVGAEALARFPRFPSPDGLRTAPGSGSSGDPGGRRADGVLSPAQWFEQATSVGLGIDLELAAIRAALAELPRFPRGLALSVNASPATIASGRLTELIDGPSADQVVVEIAEREGNHELPTTLDRLLELRDLGTRIAVDNVGVAYASLRRMVQFLPDVVKMDRWLSMNVGSDAARRALVEALVHFSRQIGATLVAEGIETADELRVLSAAGVDQGQGEFLSPPGPLPLPAHGRCVAVKRSRLAATAMT